MVDVDDLVARLASIEEELRDLTYDALRARAAGNGDKDVEKRYEQARRAVEKAVRALRATAGEVESD
jgi:hypothetical protein